MGRELIELSNQYKDIEERYKQKKEQMKNLFLSEGISEKVIDGMKILQIPENSLERVVNKETLVNVVSEKINDAGLAGELIAELLKNSQVKSYIKVVPLL